MNLLYNLSAILTLRLTAQHPRFSEERTSNHGAALADDRDRTNAANYNGCSITQLPPELHLKICQDLDSKSMMNLRATRTLFSRNIGKAEVLSQSLREALRMDSPAGNNHVYALRKMGATLSPEELTQALREALRMNSPAGNNHVSVLREMGATLSPEELAQALREALRMNSPAGNNHVSALEKMGATLSPEELTQALREALRMNSPAGKNHSHALRRMVAILPKKPL